MTTIEELRRSQPAQTAELASTSTDGRANMSEHVLLTTQEAAALTTYTPHGLENLRSAGRGPAFIKMRGGAVAYRLADLLAWQESHRISTIDQL